jgi:glutathione S-transferase
MRKGKNFDPEFLKVNPKGTSFYQAGLIQSINMAGTVPVLVADGKIYTDSTVSTHPL